MAIPPWAWMSAIVSMAGRSCAMCSLVNSPNKWPSSVLISSPTMTSIPYRAAIREASRAPVMQSWSVMAMTFRSVRVATWLSSSTTVADPSLWVV